MWDVQQILWRDLLLHVTRLTDPATMDRHENLSVQALPPLCQRPELQAEYPELHAVVQALVDTAVAGPAAPRDWRNRRISHADRDQQLTARFVEAGIDPAGGCVLGGIGGPPRAVRPTAAEWPTMDNMTLEQRVSAAVDEVVAATNPEQIVLFGSVAKGTAGPESDIDLLVIGDPRRHADGRRTCARTGDEVDVFVTDRASADRYRYSAAYLEGIALGEGRTVYARDPERVLPAGEGMVKRTRYDPDKAVEWVEKARSRLKRFERDEEDDDKCESLADAAERALKAVIVAGGQRVEHRHELDQLWTQANAAAGELPRRMDDAELKELTRYTGEALYPVPGARELDPLKTWTQLEAPVRALVEDAEQRVPNLVEQTKRSIARETAAPPPRPRIDPPPPRAGGQLRGR